MVTRADHGPYTEGALRLLQYVEARRPTGRRFGPDAEARWASFKGDLETVDRIELLLRDADAEWPGAFGARAVYAMQAVAEDEPFGSQWRGLDPVDAEELWRRVRSATPPASPTETLHAIAAAWQLPLSAFALEPVTPTDRLVVAGPSAIVAAIEAFAAGADLDWADQVTVIATPPAHRQLATAATALLNGTKPAPPLLPGETTTPPSRGARLVVSPDAHPADREAAAALAGQS
jgi:hypothetical protein